jgi:hypothetical protein
MKLQVSKSEPQNQEKRRTIDEGRRVELALLNLFFKRAEFIHSPFDLPEADKCLLASGELDVH